MTQSVSLISYYTDVPLFPTPVQSAQQPLLLWFPIFCLSLFTLICLHTQKNPSRSPQQVISQTSRQNIQPNNLYTCTLGFQLISTGWRQVKFWKLKTSAHMIPQRTHRDLDMHHMRSLCERHDSTCALGCKSDKL